MQKIVSFYFIFEKTQKPPNLREKRGKTAKFRWYTFFDPKFEISVQKRFRKVLLASMCRMWYKFCDTVFSVIFWANENNTKILFCVILRIYNTTVIKLIKDYRCIKTLGRKFTFLTLDCRSYEVMSETYFQLDLYALFFSLMLQIPVIDLYHVLYPSARKRLEG